MQADKIRRVEWTIEDDRILVTRWKAGLRVADIAERLGRSKCSIIGRAHRLGLGPHATPRGRPRKVA